METPRRALVVLVVVLVTSLDIASFTTAEKVQESRKDSESSGGIFGSWKEDENYPSFPAFNYTFDEIRDPRSPWPNSEDIFPMDRIRRDHFAIIGNSRTNALAVDYGYASLMSCERGPRWLNYFDEEGGQYGGGYSFVKLRTPSPVIFSTAHAFAPKAAKVERQFGIASFINKISYAGVDVTHTLWMPYGYVPAMIDDVVIVNSGSTPLNISHYEFFDVNHLQLSLQWIRTGDAAPIGDYLRRRNNALFMQQTAFTSDPLPILSSSMKLKNPTGAPPRNETNNIDYYPPEIFLASLTDYTIDQSRCYSDQNRFFGKGGLANPDAIANDFEGDLLSWTDGQAQQAMLSMRNDLYLQPGQQVSLRFAFGYVPQDMSIAVIVQAALQAHLATTKAMWNKQAVSIKINNTSFLSPQQIADISRESIWRSLQYPQSTYFHEYFERFVIAQGSAYFYLHGADGVARDVALFSIPLTYTNPPLARECLEFIMMVADAETGQFWYAWDGFGAVSTALDLHAHPSDIDIFLFLGLAEYITATGDLAFLNSSVPFYPKGSYSLPPGAKGLSVLDHIRAAFFHLRDQVGLGEHGLIRVRQGDWDDGICLLDPNPIAVDFTFAYDIIAPFDTDLSGEMKLFASNLVKPLTKTITSRWFGRAYMKSALNETYFFGNDTPQDPNGENYINLQSQPWGLLNAQVLLTENQTSNIIGMINKFLQSPIGPGFFPAFKGVWPAVSQLLTWAYANLRRYDDAWDNLARHLYSTHAEIFPEVWIGVMSGPDGFMTNATTSFQPGGTYASPATPMTDFPVANANADTMFILGLIRNMGVQPIGRGMLQVDAGAFDLVTPFEFSTALLSLSSTQLGSFQGTYNCPTTQPVRLSILPSPKFAASNATLILDGASIPLPGGGVGSFSFSIDCSKFRSHQFSVSWN